MRNVYYHKETFGKKHYVEEPRGEWRFSHGEVSSSGVGVEIRIYYDEEPCGKKRYSHRESSSSWGGGWR